METEIQEIKFTALTQGGDAIGRDSNGRVVFVPYLIAGETARVEITSAKKEFARGRAIEILSSSPERVPPRCPHFGACGGCQWQHIAYPAQLEFKTQIVKEQFARIAKMPDAPIAAMIPAVEEWGYRNQMRFAVDRRGLLSLQALESHTLIPIRECHIMNSPLMELFNNLDMQGADFKAVIFRAGENTGERMIIFKASEADPPELESDEAVSLVFQVGETVVPLIGSPHIRERIRQRDFRISANAFFQTNTVMAETLIALVEQFLIPRESDTLLDAYSGVGLFGLSIAERVAKVIEIEENPASIADARFNAGEWLHIEFHNALVESALPRLDHPVDIVVADPPRTGMARAVPAALASKNPRAIAYVSCDPTTLARDARLIVEQGYRLEQVQPVDLFPQTYHIECVAHFSRPD